MRLGLVAAAWLGGVLLGLQSDIASTPLFLLLGASVLGVATARVFRLPVFPVLLLPFLLLGIWRAEASQADLAPLVIQPEQQVMAEGRISDDPGLTGRRVVFELTLTSVDRGDGLAAAEGRLLVYVEPSAGLVRRRSPPFFRYGDRVIISGLLQEPEPFGEFDYPAYLASQGISGVLYGDKAILSAEGGGGWRGAAFSLRHTLSEGIERAFPYPESAMGKALLLGQRGGLHQDLKDKFRGTGASHLLAISGLHVGILMFAVMGVAAWALGRRGNYYLLAPLAAVWVYAVVSGGSPSVMRAAAMGSVYLAALALGRPGSVLPALALAAALMTAVSPGLLWQVSFQLSFAAVAGIAVAQALFGGWLAAMGEGGAGWRTRLLQPVASLATVSAAAALATWPLAAAHFNQVALLSIPVSLAAVPAMPLVIGGTLLAAVASVVDESLGTFVGWIAAMPVTYLIEAVSVFPSWVWPVGGMGKGLLGVWYGGLGLLLVTGQRDWFARVWEKAKPTMEGLAPPAFSPKLPLVVLAAVAMATAAGLLWMRVGDGADGRLHVYFLDVGQGDSILVVTPRGRQVLIDGGPDQQDVMRVLSETLGRGDRSLDLVVLTHLDADHSRGLIEVLESYDVGAVLAGREAPSASMYPQWHSALNRSGMEALPVYEGFGIQLEPGVTMEVLNPASDSSGTVDPNDDGLVVRLSYGSTSFLLTADIEADAEKQLASRGAGLASTVLKVPHHGSKTSSTAGFLERVDPALAVISAGRDNSFGHPHASVVRRLEERLGPGSVFRTDRDGTVEVVSDGSRLWARVEFERQNGPSYARVSPVLEGANPSD